MATIVSNFTDGAFSISDDAAHSSTLPLPTGSFSLSGLMPDGREAETYQSKGATSGLRKGPRAYPQISVQGQLQDAAAAFQLLATGKTAAFVSTTLDIGDYPAVDGSFDFSYGATSRLITFEDAHLTELSIEEGSPSTISFTFEIVGPLKVDGTALVSSR